MIHGESSLWLHTECDHLTVNTDGREEGAPGGVEELQEVSALQ